MPKPTPHHARASHRRAQVAAPAAASVASPPEVTARLSVLVTPITKRRLEAEAAAKGTTVGEIVRRRLDGDPAAIAAELAALIPAAKGNPGADYYRAQATAALADLVETLQSMGVAYSYHDFCALLRSERVMAWLRAACSRDAVIVLERARVAVGRGAPV